MSCIIFSTEVNAVEVSGVYLMERKSPVTICRVRVIPSRNPMFHRNEIDEGVGRSKREDLTIVIMGLVLDSWVFIRRLRTRIGLG